MAENDVDYHIDEDLERLFHSDLQNLELGHNGSGHDDVVGDHLPEWLIGVIVVIIMLIVAFFVMIITSLIKNRQKTRSSTYIGNVASTVCDEIETGKIVSTNGTCMKMTSFNTVTDTADDEKPSGDQVPLADNEEQTDDAGCKNPLFVDDEQTDNNDGRKHDGNHVTDPAAKSTSHKNKHAGGARKSLQEDHVTESQVNKKMFSSKGKNSGQTLQKRERSKSMSAGDDVTEDHESEHQPKRNSINVTPARHASANGSESCCEDSGVELGASESTTPCESSGQRLVAVLEVAKDVASSDLSEKIINVPGKSAFTSTQVQISVHSEGVKGLFTEGAKGLFTEGAKGLFIEEVNFLENSFTENKDFGETRTLDTARKDVLDTLESTPLGDAQQPTVPDVHACAEQLAPEQDATLSCDVYGQILPDDVTTNWSLNQAAGADEKEEGREGGATMSTNL
ncbi:uncharacterized protein LOC131953190 [Physella acuta]|uniref:uncharacterized protein LOC131953190 n=1 Tax=Physella acuta TaxID=109671 RepID=UPI0027DCECBA|nr:uncharacterized protein LOC131953190 [Physella acuta]